MNETDRAVYERVVARPGGEEDLALALRASRAWHFSAQMEVLRKLDREMTAKAPAGRPGNVVSLRPAPAPTLAPAPAPPPKPAAPPKPEAKGRDRFVGAVPASIDPADPKLHRMSRSALLAKTQVAFGTAVDPNSTIFQLETLWLQRGHAIPWNSRLEPDARVLASFTAAQKVAHTAEAERILELFQKPSNQNL